MPETMSTVEIDEAIERTEKLYRAMTGEAAPPAGESAYAPIPVEKDPTRYVEEQVDRLLGMLRMTPGQALAAPWVPPLSVWESDQEILALMDLPGVTRDRVEVSVQGSVLTITGERPSAVPEELRLRINERPLGTFRRALWIPVGARSAEAAVNMREGVLEIRIPKEPIPVPSVKKLSVN
jgi:HSP20 family protein